MIMRVLKSIIQMNAMFSNFPILQSTTPYAWFDTVMLSGSSSTIAKHIHAFRYECIDSLRADG